MFQISEKILCIASRKCDASNLFFTKINPYKLLRV